MKGRRKEKKKGFTLIELLAVIVILAIIALIATPMILGVIEKSRKSAFQDSVYSIFEAVDYYKIENEIGSLPREGISVQELNLKNKDQFISGVLKENEKEIRIENISNGIYCGNGTMNNLEISKRNCGVVTEEKYFTFDESTGTIIAYSNEGPKDVIIPDKINGISVTSIGTNAFKSKQLKSVTIPNSVVSIGDWAFSNNQLTSVTIPNNVKEIEYGAFYMNQLTNIIISNGVVSIERSAFDSNQLTSITIPSSVTSIGDYAFSNNQLTSITIPNSVKEIKYGAFYMNQLTNIIISNGVVSIGDYAFQGNQLTSITIPSSVTSIGNGVFHNNQLTIVKIIGKTTSSNFTTYGTNIWGFASGYNESCITWNASE